HFEVRVKAVVRALCLKTKLYVGNIESRYPLVDVFQVLPDALHRLGSGKVSYHRYHQVLLFQLLQELVIIFRVEIVLLAAAEVSLDKQVTIGRIYRARRTMVAEVPNIQTRRKERSLNFDNSLEICVVDQHPH